MLIFYLICLQFSWHPFLTEWLLLVRLKCNGTLICEDDVHESVTSCDHPSAPIHSFLHVCHSNGLTVAGTGISPAQLKSCTRYSSFWNISFRELGQHLLMELPGSQFIIFSHHFINEYVHVLGHQLWPTRMSQVEHSPCLVKFGQGISNRFAGSEDILWLQLPYNLTECKLAWAQSIDGNHSLLFIHW